MGKMVTKPAITDQNKTLLRQTSRIHWVYGVCVL